MIQDQLVFSTHRYGYLQDALLHFDGFEAGSLERIVFPDGERYQRLDCSVRGRDIVLIGGTDCDTDTLELYDLAFGLVQHGAGKLTMVVPYFGYSTMERAVKAGEIVTAKARAILLSSIPMARTFNEIIMIDLHTGGIPHYFEGHLRPYHINAKRVIEEIVTSLGNKENLIIASTDAGRAKWVETLANEFGIPAAFVYKQRKSGDQTEIRGINADVRGRDVVIYDDMIRTGGSLIQAGRAYKDAGAKKIYAITTHGIFPGNALEKIQNSQVFECIYATDTHPKAVSLQQECSDQFLQVRSLVPDLARFLLDKESFDAFLHT